MVWYGHIYKNRKKTYVIHFLFTYHDIACFIITLVVAILTLAVPIITHHYKGRAVRNFLGGIGRAPKFLSVGWGHTDTRPAYHEIVNPTHEIWAGQWQDPKNFV